MAYDSSKQSLADAYIIDALEIAKAVNAILKASGGHRRDTARQCRDDFEAILESICESRYRHDLDAYSLVHAWAMVEAPSAMVAEPELQRKADEALDAFCDTPAADLSADRADRWNDCAGAGR